jgi:hypothetical protein
MKYQKPRDPSLDGSNPGDRRIRKAGRAHESPDTNPIKSTPAYEADE